MKKAVSKTNIVIFFTVILVYSLFCLTKYQHVRLTADSMLYFSIAKNYLAGDFQNAINGYWGPLLAWLIVPFLYFGFSDVFTINMLNLIFGAFTIAATWILTFRFEISERVRSVLLVCLLPIMLMFSIVQPMDFLLVCILIFYLGVVFRDNYSEHIRFGMFSGFLGSLAYFAKAYAFPFFIVHFFIMNIFHYFGKTGKEDRRQVLRNMLAGFIVFFMISGAWILLISDKYDHYTFSTMRDTNFNAPGPEVQGGGLEFGVPVFTEGFFEPPNEAAFVVWEDPSYLRGKPWSALQSLGHFKHFIKLVIKNIGEGLKIFESFSTFSVMIIIAYLVLLITQPGKEMFSHGALLYPLFTLILFSGGYLLFHFEARYVWLPNILLLLMGGHTITILFNKDLIKSGFVQNILLGIFVISFVFVPSKLVVQAGEENIEDGMYYLSTDLEKYNIKGNIASNREPGTQAAWHKTFRLAYWLNSRYYGQRGEGTSDEELENELKKHDIDYYFFWGETDSIPRFLNNKKELSNGETSGLKIFSLNENIIE